jgi:probable rRNA maturation factor
MIQILNSSSKKPLPVKKIKKAVENTLVGEKTADYQIDVIFIDDEYMQKLNIEYLQHHYTTDVLSFPLGEADTVEGEIYISPHVALQQANEYKTSLTKELMRLSIHGTLHLIGYDDADAESRKKMTELEDLYLWKTFSEND